MGAGRKLGYAAAIAGGLLLATAWAVAAQNQCNSSFSLSSGLTFPTGCDDPDPGGPYRAPLLQFIADWNRAEDPASLIAEAPVYEGADPVLLPAIAVVVHALADRAGVTLPGWVLVHRAPEDVMLFGWRFDGDYGRFVRRRATAACAHHRVWFHPRTLDKGTPDWWLPWD